MKTISSREVQKNFGSIVDLVGSGESVRVTRYGRPAFLIIPESRDMEEIMRRLAGKKLVQVLDDAKPNPAALALTQEDINKMINECFS